MSKILEKCRAQLNIAQAWLDRVEGNPYVADEVALMFECPGDRYLHWMREIIKSPDWAWSNSAEDSVDTEPFGTNYKVQYDFITNAQENWRLECMTGAYGSPLHMGLSSGRIRMPEDITILGDGGVLHFDEPLIVHVSFKCESMEQYDRACAWLSHNADSAQSCKSTYGEFSYWRVPDLAAYLKPRVNLRDAS